MCQQQARGASISLALSP